MARRVGSGWLAANGRVYATYKTATRAERTGQVSTASQAARRRKTRRRMRGRRRRGRR